MKTLIVAIVICSLVMVLALRYPIQMRLVAYAGLGWAIGDLAKWLTRKF